MSSVLQTLCYFDLFEYPLTTFEVWEWLWSESGKAVTLGEVDDYLREMLKLGRLGTQDGFWFLVGRENFVATRHERHRVSIFKFARARKMVRLFSWLPWVEGVAVCNSLGYHNATEKSDIDLFVITSPNTIWLTRFFAAGIMALLGERPTEGHTADTICLSFFVSRDSLNLERLKKTAGDPYFIYWMTQLLPIFGRGSIWYDFWQANSWVKKTLPNALPYQTQSPLFYRSGASWWTLPLGLPEAIAKKVQLLRLPKKLVDHASGGSNVVISDQVLKFHATDRRDEYRTRWENSLKALQI